MTRLNGRDNHVVEMKKNLVECEDGLDIPEEDDYDDEIVNNHRKDKRLKIY